MIMALLSIMAVALFLIGVALGLPMLFWAIEWLNNRTIPGVTHVKSAYDRWIDYWFEKAMEEEQK